MGDVVTRPSLLWRLTGAVSALLSPAERLAVLGDLAEVHVRDGDALRHVAGLVIRRQCQYACSMPGFLGIVLLALPLGIVLSERSTHWAAGTGVYLWTYVHAGNFEPLARTVWATGDTTGIDVLVWVLLNAATLAVWSCATGWVLGVFARRRIWMSVAAFYGIVLLNKLPPEGGRLRARLKVADAPPPRESLFIGGTCGPASPTCSAGSSAADQTGPAES